MKSFVPVLAVAVAVAIVVFRPPAAPPPVVASWASSAPEAHRRPPRETAARDALVYVAGAVAHPGVYRLGSDARVRDALRLAGGVRSDADPVAVNFAAHLRDGDEIVVPLRGDPGSGAAGAPDRPPRSRRRRGARYRPAADASGIVADAGAASSPGDGRSAGRARTSRHGRRNRTSSLDAAPPAASIDLNSADAQTLASVPGIGPGLAIRIVAFREANGPFASADELLDVSGITDRRLDAILPYVVAR